MLTDTALLILGRDTPLLCFYVIRDTVVITLAMMIALNRSLLAVLVNVIECRILHVPCTVVTYLGLLVLLVAQEEDVIGNLKGVIGRVSCDDVKGTGIHLDCPGGGVAGSTFLGALWPGEQGDPLASFFNDEHYALH
jgi:hypothetical protein